jgi:hypothetical protein
MDEQTRVNEPVVEEQQQQQQQGRSWTEEVEVAANDLVGSIKKLIKEGNVRRIVVRQPNGEVLLSIPLTVGAAVGGLLTLAQPVLAALVVLAGALAKFKLEVVRTNDGNQA